MYLCIWWLQLIQWVGWVGLPFPCPVINRQKRAYIHVCAGALLASSNETQSNNKWADEQFKSRATQSFSTLPRTISRAFTCRVELALTLAKVACSNPSAGKTPSANLQANDTRKNTLARGKRISTCHGGTLGDRHKRRALFAALN